MIPSRYKEIEIPEANPFANDALGRDKFAATLESIVSVYAETGCVISLNGEWGTGKTTFVKMLSQDMRNKGYHPLYFNAWTNDFVSDPLGALLSELKEIFPKTDKWDKVITLGGKIAVDVVAQATKSIIEKKLGIDVKDIAKTISSDLKKGIDEYSEQKKAFEDFKQALQEYVTDNTTAPDKPVVFFVDELDRCNPHFAVQVLERIKHLFDIPNVIFVIVINKHQLGHAVCGYYGSEGMDADNYFRRFFDIELTIPDVDLEKYIDVLYTAYDFDAVLDNSSRHSNYRLRQDAAAFRSILKYLLSTSNFDLRTIDKFFAYTRLALQTFGNSAIIYSDVYILMCYLKFANPQLYHEIVSHSTSSVNDLAWSLESGLSDVIRKMQAQSFSIESLTGFFAHLIVMYMSDQRVNYNEHLFDQLEFSYIDKQLFLRFVELSEKAIEYSSASLNYVIEHIEIQNGLTVN